MSMDVARYKHNYESFYEKFRPNVIDVIWHTNQLHFHISFIFH